jgi:mono/diheme cytochrome c family protein
MDHRELSSRRPWPALLTLALVTSGCPWERTKPNFPDESADSGALGGEAPTEDAPELDDCDDPALAVAGPQQLFTSCGGCHSGGEREGGFGSADSPQGMVDDGLVVPGSAEESRVWVRIENESMPIGAAPLTAEQKALVKHWIDCGAPTDVAPRTFISRADQLRAILLDLEENIDPEDRRFARYFSVVEDYNAGVSAAFLETTRVATMKTLTSLPLDPQQLEAVPVPILALDGETDLVDDAAAGPLLIRVDIRRFGFTAWQVDGWERMLRFFPFAAQFSPELHGVAVDYQQEIQQLTGSRQAFVPAAWFVSEVAKPELYHELADIPATLDAFLAQHGVALVRINEVGGREVGPPVNAECAGFTDSGVSAHNRLICRLSTAIGPEDEGYCWISYDFASTAGQENIIAHPMDFIEAGSEVICTNTAGAQRYLISDAVGNRIDFAPREVVHDPENDRPELGTGNSVMNGGSCHTCHGEGIKQKPDQIRDAVLANQELYSPEVVGLVLDTYLPGLEDEALLDADLFNVYQGLMGTSNEEAEAILLVVKRYEDKLNATEVAAELGVEKSTLLELLEARPEIHLQVANLTTGGEIDRTLFESLAHELICSLDIGTCSSDEGCGPAELPCEEGQVCVEDGQWAGACVDGEVPEEGESEGGEEDSGGEW